MFVDFVTGNLLTEIDGSQSQQWRFNFTSFSDQFFVVVGPGSQSQQWRFNFTSFSVQFFVLGLLCHES